MDLALREKVALVTGAGGGIGASITAKLVEEGCLVHAADIDLTAAEAAATRAGATARALQLDVTDPRAIDAAVGDIVKMHGALDILVNNAGILKTGSIAESSIEDWDQVCRTNLSSVFYCCKAVLPTMVRKRYGKIINIASMSAARAGGALGNVLYGTTKAGVVAFTKGFARELAPYGINVNAVAPGLLETAMTAARLTPDVREQILAAIPMHRLASVEDVANAVAFLASDVAAYISGDTLLVDGATLKK
jgi:NAD(P)-dependent dehydrogenase (short-subunit alcohol dehydrogenase family)